MREKITSISNNIKRQLEKNCDELAQFNGEVFTRNGNTWECPYAATPSPRYGVFHLFAESMGKAVTNIPTNLYSGVLTFNV